MPVPFQAASWAKRSDIPSQTLNGGISGIVGGVFGASFHPSSKVLQAFGPIAHSFTSYFGCALASVDEGKAWVDTYRGDLEPTAQQQMCVVGGFSLDLPSGRTYHYQVRVQLTHSFFVADGSLAVGGIHLYASDNGTSYFFVRSLYTWPNVIADPVNTGGNAVVQTFPSFTPAILFPGSGPGGVDAYWMAVGYRLDVGGNNNRQTFQSFDLWRSLDGFDWQIVRDLSTVGFNNVSFTNWLKSPTGRIFLGHSVGLLYTDAGTPDTASWAGSNGLIGPLGPYVIPMYGGTFLTNRHGSLISAGFAQVSCNDGANFQAASGPTIPANHDGICGKIGPTEAIIVTAGLSDPTTQTVCYYSSDGGETWQGGEVWIASNIGEAPNALFIKSDGRPLVITQRSCFVSADTARGIATGRVICPLANAGLAAARPLLVCGAPLTPICKD